MTGERMSAGRIVMVVLIVALGVPLGLGAWIGLVLLADRLNVDISADEIFSWMIAAATALLLWPLAMWGLRRQLWQRRSTAAGDEGPWGGGPAPAVPAVRLTAGDVAGRAAVVIVGGAALFLLCGSRPITILLLQALASGSAGTRSAWTLLQLAAFLLTMAVALPTLIITDRALRRVPPGAPGRLALEQRQNWYYAAAVSWVACLLVGFIFSSLVLTRL